MRENIQLECSVCHRINYSSTRDKKQNPDKLELKKYCRFCRKHVLHREVKK